MLILPATRLRRIGTTIFVAAGASDADAAFVADSLVEANLMGHDSHGVIRIPAYVDEIGQGTIKPSHHPEVVKETATTALVSGNWTFGQVACKFAMELAIAKAREMNVAVVGVVQCNHNGRVGQYVTMAARQGLIAMMTMGGDRGGARVVAPHGGRTRMLLTSPYAFAVPAGTLPPFVADFAASVVAEGKLQVARAMGAELPAGLILDREGQPSTNVEDFYAGGTILPAAGHKGYALILLAEMLGGLLMGGDLFTNGVRTTANFLLVINPAAFRPLEDYTGVVEKRLRQMKDSPPAPGFQEVLIPGEKSVRTQTQREQQGIPLAEETWDRILAAARAVGANLDVQAGS